MLFRAPYFGDAEPRTPDEVDPTVQAQNLGYISVGLHLDPDDWKLKNDDGTPHTADQMVEECLRQAAITTPEERGNIILMHDSGGDRSATVEALPRTNTRAAVAGLRVHDRAGPRRHDARPGDAAGARRINHFMPSADSYVFYGTSIAGLADEMDFSASASSSASAEWR